MKTKEFVIFNGFLAIAIGIIGLRLFPGDFIVELIACAMCMLGGFSFGVIWLGETLIHKE